MMDYRPNLRLEKVRARYSLTTKYWTTTPTLPPKPHSIYRPAERMALKPKRRPFYRAVKQQYRELAHTDSGLPYACYQYSGNALTKGCANKVANCAVAIWACN